MTENADDKIKNGIERELARAIFSAENDKDERSQEAWQAARKDKLKQARKIITVLQRRGHVELTATDKMTAET